MHGQLTPICLDTVNAELTGLLLDLAAGDLGDEQAANVIWAMARYCETIQQCRDLGYIAESSGYGLDNPFFDLVDRVAFEWGCTEYRHEAATDSPRFVTRTSQSKPVSKKWQLLPDWHTLPLQGLGLAIVTFGLMKPIAPDACAADQLGRAAFSGSYSNEEQAQVTILADTEWTCHVVMPCAEVGLPRESQSLMREDLEEQPPLPLPAPQQPATRRQ